MLKAFRPLQIALALFAAGFLSAALQISDDAALSSGFETVAVARNLAAGRGFSNPYDALPTGPTAHVSPAYPALMALVIMLCGYGTAFAAIVVFLQFALYGLQVALLPAVSLRLLGRRRPGYFAAFALVCLPLMPILPQFEMGLQIVLLLLYVLIPVAAGSAVPAALLAALTLHVNPSSIFLLAGWMAWKRPALRWTATWIFTLVLACLPWTIRNYAVLGRLTFIRNNLPLELRIANNDIAGANFFDNLQSFRTLHPNNNAAEAAAVARLGESAYFDMCGRQAQDWIRRNPGRFIRLTLERVWLYWFPHTEPIRLQGWLVGLLTLLALPALPRLRRSPVFVSGLCLAPVLYFVVEADIRYRMPYLWITLLAAGLTVSTLLERRPRLRLTAAP